MNRHKYIVKLIAVNLSILVAGAVLLELIFGNWLGADRSNRLHVRRDVLATFDVSELYETGEMAVYRRDEYGLRGSYTSPADIDILTLGGSTTDQRYITEGATWQDVLAQEFAAHCRTVNVANAGVDGQSTIGHLKNFEWWFPTIPALHAKYYLFNVGVNDFFIEADLSNANTLHRYGPFMSLIENNSAIYNLGRTLKGIQEARVAKVGHYKSDFLDREWTDTPTINNYEELMSARLVNYAARLRALGHKVREVGAIPICVTQPLRTWKQEGGQVKGQTQLTRFDDETRINGVDYYYMMKMLNETTLATCLEIGGIPIDVANNIQWEDGDFYDNVHNTPQGAAKIGRYLYSELDHLFCER